MQNTSFWCRRAQQRRSPETDPHPRALVTRFLSYATRGNSSTDKQQAGRRKYTLKKKAQAAQWESLPQEGASVFLLVGVPHCDPACLLGFGLFPTPPGGKETAPGHLFCLLAWACFSCWGLTLEIKTRKQAEWDTKQKFQSRILDGGGESSLR